MTTPRRMTKRQAGSVTCDGGTLTVIDKSAIVSVRVEVSCNRCGKITMVDVMPAAIICIDQATRGALTLPAGDYHAVVNVGHSGQVLSAQLVRD